MVSKNNCLCLFTTFLAFVFLLIVVNPPKIRENFCGKKNKKLLPIMDPMYNMREFCKQSILLEDHLTHPRKSCSDCIKKHSLSLEALAEEACTLDNNGKYKDILLPLPEKCRQLQKRLYTGEDPHIISQEFRKLRKKLMPMCYNNF